MRVRREHLVTGLILAWITNARASDEDVAIERASNDLACDDLRMMHAKDEYAFVGCGKRRAYECRGGKCEDVTNRKVLDVDATCAVVVSASMVVATGCLCLTLASKSAPSTPLPVPDVARGACQP